MKQLSNKSAAPIRVGLIGVGNWASQGHLRVLDLLPEYEVVALQSRRREAAEEAAARFSVKHVLITIEELLALPDIDLVLVLNTAPQHAETVRAVIAAGKDVYCEWPLSVDTNTARDLAFRSHAAGVRHVVGLQRRLAPHNRYLRELIATGYVGTLRSVRMHVSMNYFQALRAAALRWTAPPENFSSVIAIYAGHFLDMLFEAVGRPLEMSTLLVNQFPEVTIAGTGEVLPTTNPDQLVLATRLAGTTVLSVHIEGGKRNGSGVQIDITGDQGDLRIANSSAFGEVGDDYLISGAHEDGLEFSRLEIPTSYDWLPPSGLPSAVLELANLYSAFARDRASGSREAPDFDDAVWLHHFFDLMKESSQEKKQVHIDNLAHE